MSRRVRICLLFLVFLFLCQPVKAEELESLEPGEGVVIEEEYDNIRVLRNLPVFKKEGFVMVPLREIGEKLDFEIQWNKELKQVEVSKGSFKSSLKDGLNIYFLGEESPTKLCLAPEIKDGIMYVPIEFFERILKQPIFLVQNNLLLIYENKEMSGEEEELATIQGYVKEVFKNEEKLYGETITNVALFVSVQKSDLELSDVVVHIMDETKIYDYEGETIKKDELKVGNEVEIVIPRMMTMSIPPQTTAMTVVVDDGLEIIRSKDGNLYYPEVHRLGDDFYSNSIKNRCNEIIGQFLEGIEELELYDDMSLDYFITNLDDDILSIVFRGNYTLLKDKKDISRTLNIDRNRVLKIDLDNYFKQDKESQARLKNIIKKSARQQYGVEYRNEDLDMYFTEDYVVFYYFEDGEDVPIEIYVLRTDIEDLILKQEKQS